VDGAGREPAVAQGGEGGIAKGYNPGNVIGHISAPLWRYDVSESIYRRD
jgi:hypothetical protein